MNKDQQDDGTYPRQDRQDVPHMPRGPLPPPQLRHFQTQTRTALLDLLRAPEYSSVWHTFVDAYQFRRAFPWLDESGQRGGEDKVQAGLTAALRDALEIYDSPDPFEDAEQDVAHEARPAALQQAQPCPPLSNEWVDSLGAAVLRITRDYLAMQAFARALLWADVDLGHLPPDILRTHLLNALLGYAEHREMGVWRSPF